MLPPFFGALNGVPTVPKRIGKSRWVALLMRHSLAHAQNTFSRDDIRSSDVVAYVIINSSVSLFGPRDDESIVYSAAIYP
jgi:hypothetical protein